MFESDDFDQILSQLDYTENLSESERNQKTHQKNYIHQNISSENSIIEPSNEEMIFRPVLNNCINEGSTLMGQKRAASIENQFEDYDNIEICKDFEDSRIRRCQSPRQNKKRLLESFFDHQSKRKFPGPAGLLSHTRSHCPHDDELSRIEISSQDVDYSKDHLHLSIFELKLWTTLQEDLRTWGVDRIDCISDIQQPELTGRITNRKAHAVTAFVEAVDRSVDNPLIILRDSSGTIKCTLHRDAWSAFATCIMSDYAAIALWKPSVLTTGTTFKKHYLNITLCNIVAIYYSGCNNASQDSGDNLPSGYCKIISDEFIAIKMDTCKNLINDASVNVSAPQDKENESTHHLEGLDCLSFLDEIF